MPSSTQKTKKRSARPSSGTPALVRNPRDRKKKLYKKSRYYRQRQRRRLLLGGILLILLLIVLISSIRSCASKDAKTADSSSVNRENELSSTKTEDLSDDNTVSMEKPDGKKDDSAKDAAPAPAEPISLTVSVVGDCTLGTDEYFDYSTSLNAYFDSYGPDYFLQNVKSIFESDDLTIANNEGTFTNSTDREDKQFAFKAGTDFAKIYSSGSVEAVNTANNHSSDYGQQSFADTMDALDAEGVKHFGYDETAVMEIKGVKVGLVGIYELYDHLERTQQLKDNIAKVKAEGAQLVIVILHWGNEKETVPDTSQMTLGRLAIDEGADLVCGHHPHVLQGIETYKGKNIVYSLGNFCFGGNSTPSDMDSMIFQQTFTITEEGVAADNQTNIIPCSISSEYGYNNYQPTPAEGDERARIAQKINERSSWIELSGDSVQGPGVS